MNKRRQNHREKKMCDMIDRKEETTSDSKKTSCLNIKSYELSDWVVLQHTGVCTRTDTGS